MKNKMLGVLMCMLLIITVFPGPSNKGPLGDVTEGEKHERNLEIKSMDIRSSTWTSDNLPVETYEISSFVVGGIGFTDNWAKTYGTPLNDEAACIVQTFDGGYIAAGQTTSAFNPTDILIVKIAKNGDVVWAKTYDGGGADYAFSIVETKIPGPAPTYEYLVAGYTNSVSITNVDFMVMKLDENGNHLWAYTYGGGGNDYAYSVSPCPLLGGFNYVVAGFSYSFGTTADALVIYLGFNGNIIHAGAYDTGGEDRIYSVECSTTDTAHGFIVAGYTNPGIFGGEDILVFKIDESFPMIPIWAYEYAALDIGGTSYHDNVYYMKPLDDGYIYVGYSNSPASGTSWDMLVMKTDSNGNLVWMKTYDGGDSDFARSIDIEPSGYILTGYTYSCGAVNNLDLIVAKIDNSGNFIQGKILEDGDVNNCHIPLLGDEYGYSITQTTAGYVAGGYTNSLGAGGNDFLVVSNFERIAPPCCQRNCSLREIEHMEWSPVKMWMSSDEIHFGIVEILQLSAEIMTHDICVMITDKCLWSGKGDNLLGWYHGPTEIITLPSIPPIKFTFWTLGGIIPIPPETDDGDLCLSYDGGDTWITLFNLTKCYTEWTKIECDLSPWAGETVKIRFGYYTGLDSPSPGWYIDDLEITAEDIVILSEDFDEYSVGSKLDDWVVVEKPDRLEIDTTPPVVALTRPKEGTIYIQDDGKIDIRDLAFALIIGKITIEGHAYDNESGIKGVEIYIDDKLKAKIPFEPDDGPVYRWLWDETVFGIHTIDAKAYDNAGNVGVTDSPVLVLIFNIS
jgi:hypothetical protein